MPRAGDRALCSRVRSSVTESSSARRSSSAFARATPAGSSNTCQAASAAPARRGSSEDGPGSIPDERPGHLTAGAEREGGHSGRHVERNACVVSQIRGVEVVAAGRDELRDVQRSLFRIRAPGCAPRAGPEDGRVRTQLPPNRSRESRQGPSRRGRPRWQTDRASPEYRGAAPAMPRAARAAPGGHLRHSSIGRISRAGRREPSIPSWAAAAATPTRRRGTSEPDTCGRPAVHATVHTAPKSLCAARIYHTRRQQPDQERHGTPADAVRRR